MSADDPMGSHPELAVERSLHKVAETQEGAVQSQVVAQRLQGRESLFSGLRHRLQIRMKLRKQRVNRFSLNLVRRLPGKPEKAQMLG